ncbi:MAG: hypothetical protein K8S20_09540 [Chloroflexi bacterium]|nr:hypothetical protein [Chloroflexota bacterium]
MSRIAKSSARIKLTALDSFAIYSGAKLEYLIQYQNELWAAIRQKQKGVWQFVTFLAGAIMAGALLVSAGVVQVRNGLATFDYLHIPGTFLIPLICLIFILVSFWGIGIALDANYWENRNQWLISNIGSRILGKGAVSKVLPKDISNPAFQYSTTSCIHINFLFVIAGIFASGNLLLLKFMGRLTGVLQEIGVGMLGVLLGGLVIYVLIKNFEWVRRYHQDIEQTGINRTGFVSCAAYHQDKVWLTSPLLMWLHVFSIFNFYSSVWELTRAFVIPFPSAVNSLIVLCLGTSVFFLYWVKQKRVTGYINRGENFIAKGISGRKLLERKEVQGLRFVSQMTSGAILALNSISIILSGFPVIHAFLTNLA